MREQHAIPATTLSRVAAVLAIVVALVLPLGYYTVGHNNLSISLQGDADILAGVVGKVIQANPIGWKFVSHFDDILRRNTRQSASVVRLIDAERQVVAQTGPSLEWPAARADARVYDSGTAVGQLIVEQSLRELLGKTSLAALLGLLLGGAVFVMLRAPLHALERTLDKLHAREAALRESEAGLVRAQRLAQLGSWEIKLDDPRDLGRNPLIWSAQTFRLFGHQPGGIEASWENLFKSIHPEDRDRVREALMKAIVNPADYELEYRVIWSDGSERIIQEIVDFARDRVAGAPVRIFGTVQDITERKRSEEKIAYLAHFDGLTGLPNRHKLHDALVGALAQRQRAGGSLGCMFIDLDGFKAVNDTFGHDVGDKLLGQAAERLRHCVRATDVVGRMGGDEFAVVLSSLATAEDAGRVAQKVIASLSAPFNLDGQETYVTASVGVAISPGDGDDAVELLKNADTAMYHAKEQGRNNHQFYSVRLNERAVQRQRLETDLRGALERQEFVLHYQPKAELDGGAICGVEALLRWRHRERGLVSPDEFIPILEETGLIVPVGEWVLNTACAQIKAWKAQGIAACPVAINVSARQFQKKTLDPFISRIREAGIDPGMIVVELTESMLMKDAEEGVRTLSSLKAAGVRLSLDDFGTGYSSLGHLKRLPLDEVKIDRTFIRDIATNPEDAEIVLAIISLAHGLRLKVVAEGVETAAQLSFLRAHGCDELQGYYFARSVNVEECTQALKEGRRLQMPGIADSSKGPPVVLLVDDDPHDLELMRRALEPGGYRILTADSARTAFEILSAHPVNIIISDHGMPAMTGVQFLASARKLYPNSIRIVLSGSGDASTVTDAINEAGIHKYLSKDWDAVRLRSEVRGAYLRHGQTNALKVG